MASERIKCPRCKNVFHKPVQYQVLGQTMQGDSSYLIMGENEVLPCGRCGHGLAKQDIINGKFDTISESNFHRTKVFYSAIATIVLIAVVLYFTLK
jgi:hypothetical protein